MLHTDFPTSQRFASVSNGAKMTTGRLNSYLEYLTVHTGNGGLYDSSLWRNPTNSPMSTARQPLRKSINIKSRSVLNLASRDLCDRVNECLFGSHDVANCKCCKGKGTGDYETQDRNFVALVCSDLPRDRTLGGTSWGL